jgi:hypothetical protein
MDRTASAKKAWETMRARKAAGLPPISAEKTAAKPERDYTGLIGAWLTPAPPAPEPPAPEALPIPAITIVIPAPKAKRAKAIKAPKVGRKPAAKKSKKQAA